MSRTQQAQSKSVTPGAEINLRDFESLPKPKGGKKLKDIDGKKKRKVTLKNMDSKLKVGTLPYISYGDWKKQGGWQSDQWSKFPMQMRMWDQADKRSGDTFFSMNEQSSFNVMDMPLYPLDVEKDIMDDFTCVFIGRRRSGKTFLSRWLMYHLRFRFPFGIVITGTKLNNFWSQYVPEEFIHEIDDISLVLDQVFARQIYIKSHPELGIDPRMFVILDDVLSDKYRIRFSVPLATIFTNGRHHNIFTLITLQDAKGIPPDLRENADLCVLFRVYEGGRQKIIKDEWLSYVHDVKNNNSNTLIDEEKKDQDTAIMTVLKKIDDRPTGGIKDKTATQLKFFWKNTGLMDKDKCENFMEGRNTTDTDREKAIPQAIAILQARTTEDLQEVFKRAVAEDPGPFILGDRDYYLSAQDGQYSRIMGTYHKFKRRGKRRVKKYVEEDMTDAESDSEEK